MKKLIGILLSLQLLLLSSASVMAQEGEAPAGGDDDLLRSTQNDVFLVAGAGAAGAVLGLSTLSFVDKPSEHLSNIWTGAAIGDLTLSVVVAQKRRFMNSPVRAGRKVNIAQTTRI